MKKHMSGFTPVNYSQAGKVLVVLGLVLFILSIIKQVMMKSDPAFVVMLLGTGMMMAGGYLIKIIPSE